MEFESIKRLGPDHIGINTEKSFETYDQDTNNHIIIIHLLKSKNIVCPLCGAYTLELKGSKSRGVCPHVNTRINSLSENCYKISISKQSITISSSPSITSVIVLV